MTVEEISEALLALLSAFEGLLVENLCLQAVMRSARPRDRKDAPLFHRVAVLLGSEQTDMIHAQFDQLRRQILQAVEEQNFAVLADAVARARSLPNPDQNLTSSDANNGE